MTFRLIREPEDRVFSHNTSDGLRIHRDTVLAIIIIINIDNSTKTEESSSRPPQRWQQHFTHFRFKDC